MSHEGKREKGGKQKMSINMAYNQRHALFRTREAGQGLDSTLYQGEIGSVSKLVHETFVEFCQARDNSRNLIFLRQYCAPEMPCPRNLSQNCDNERISQNSQS